MKWCKIMVALVVVLFFCGCTQPTENSVTPTPTDTQYTAEDLFASTDSKETIVLPEGDTEGVAGGVTSDLPEYLQPQENIDYVKYDAANRCTWPDDGLNLRSMFCVDPDTGVVYFINQNKDWYIYRLIDGVAELVIELPARELYVQNSEIYFILEDYNKYELKELTEGAVYSYTLADKKIKKLFSPDGLEDDIYRMRVYEDGVAFYCRAISEVPPRMVIMNKKEVESNLRIDNYFYFYNFATGTIQEDLQKRVFPGWDDYYMVMDYEEWEITLWSRKLHEQEQKKFPGSGLKSFIIENVLYTFAGVCQINNLLTGEQKTIDITALFKEKMPRYMEYLAKYGVDENYNVPIDAVAINKDGIWMIVQFNYLLHLNPETEEAECYRIGGSKYINDLYTDGVNLYGTYGSEQALYKYDGKLVRICPEKITGQDSMSDVPIIAVEYLTD